MSSPRSLVRFLLLLLFCSTPVLLVSTHYSLTSTEATEADYTLTSTEATEATETDYTLTSTEATEATETDYTLISTEATETDYTLTSTEAIEAIETDYSLTSTEATEATETDYLLTSTEATETDYILTSTEATERDSLGGLTSTRFTTCPESDQIHCGSSDRCTRIRYICDGDNDCGDNTDEASSLCNVWRNGDCERNSASCTRNGRSDCITISHYCSVDDPPCTGDLDRRLCQMLSGGKILPLHSIVLTTTTFAPTTPATTLPSIHMTDETYTEVFESRLNSTIIHPDCPQLYTKIGEDCLSVFFIGNMTWLESRAFCKTIGGDLLSLSTNLGMFSTILQHLSSSLITSDFWVGGRYINDTLGWTWLDNTAIAMGSPYWAVRYQDSCSTRSLTNTELNQTMLANGGACYNYNQAPSNPLAGHCAAITYEHYYYLSDHDCFAKKSPLCIKPGGAGPKQAL